MFWAGAREKMSQKEAEYQDSPKDIRMCATCTLFEPPPSNHRRSRSLLKSAGGVRPKITRQCRRSASRASERKWAI
jgi:hypothetical protein